MDAAAMELPRQSAGEFSEQNVEKRVPVGGIVEPAVHGGLSLELLKHMEADEARGASHGTGLHGHDEKLDAETNGRTQEFPQVAEYGENPGSPRQSNVPRRNVGHQNSPLPGPVVEGDQNGTPTDQPSVGSGLASETISPSAAARDTSSIPGISMLANQSIPVALFKHEEVLASKEVFSDALNKFHTVLGTRLTKKGRRGRERAAEVRTFEESVAGMPKLGGADLDLHLLYVEVTSRGGLEQVIRDRKWKEVTNLFKFSETTTSASYILRKYYVGLLYYFEQAYLHGKTGPLIPPPISMPGPSPFGGKRSDSAFTPTDGQPVFKRTRKRKLLPNQTMPAFDPTLSVGLTVRSSIEGKFEHGYIVSVTVGTEKMRGVIYHVPPTQRGPQHASIPNYESTMGAEPIAIREDPGLRGIKRKRRRPDDMPKKDPNAPRPYRTGYNFFFADQHALLRALHPHKDKELSKMIGEAWNKLTEEEKMPYQDRGMQDKERYQIELRQYLGLLRAPNGPIPTESAAKHDVEGPKEKLKEAVVDAAIDVAVDAAVNNAVDVAVDDVAVTIKSVTSGAPPANHHAPSASNSTGKAFTDARNVINGSFKPVAVEEVNTANTVPVAKDNQLDVDDGIPDTVNEAPDGSVNLLATMDFDIEPHQSL